MLIGHSQATGRLNGDQKVPMETHIVLKINFFGLFNRFGSGRNMGSLRGFKKPKWKDAQA